MKLKNGREFTELGDYGVKRKLAAMKSDSAIFWSARGNSYVVTNTDPEPTILSINGIGEIRWKIEPWNRDAESLEARGYFLEAKS